MQKEWIFLVSAVVATVFIFVIIFSLKEKNSKEGLILIEGSSENGIEKEEAIPIESATSVFHAASANPYSSENPFTKGVVKIKMKNGKTFFPAFATIPSPPNQLMAASYAAVTLPDNFDDWRQYLSVVRNQQNCGCCWAFATCETLVSRLNCESKGKWRDSFKAQGDPTEGWASVQYLISCVSDNSEKGCMGSKELQHALGDVSLDHGNKGTYMDRDYQYKDYDLGEKTQGSPCQEPAGKPRLAFVTSYAVSLLTTAKDKSSIGTNVQRMKTEIQTKGPLMTAMFVFPSFVSPDFKSTPASPYSAEPNEKMVGGHAISIVGWGTIPGKDASDFSNQYWICRNSWGPDWGDKGFWYHLMGDTQSNMEQGAVAGVPNYKDPFVESIIGSPGGGPITPSSGSGSGPSLTKIMWLVAIVMVTMVVTITAMRFLQK